jgi:hypothetical protein
LRQLFWAAEGKHQFAWQLQSALMCLLANIHRNAKKRPQPYKPQDFNPLEKIKPRKMTRAKFIESLAAFVSPARLQELRNKRVLKDAG